MSQIDTKAATGIDGLDNVLHGGFSRGTWSWWRASPAPAWRSSPTRPCGPKEVSARELAQEQLLQSQKMESVGQLTGGIAHDFNNLLMAVMANLEILRKRLPNEPGIRRLIDGAMQGAQRGSSLTQRMLAIDDGQAIDLLMTDQAMPGMTGIQLAEVVRSKRPRLPVLLATGYTDLPASKLTHLPRLSKPYQQVQLLAEIEKLLDAP